MVRSYEQRVNRAGVVDFNDFALVIKVKDADDMQILTRKQFCPTQKRQTFFLVQNDQHKHPKKKERYRNNVGCSKQYKKQIEKILSSTI